jgi:2-aminoadipate transaminase
MDATRLPLRQFDQPPGMIDLGWGHPGPDLIPTDGLRRAAARTLHRYGPDALGYGYAAGPGPLVAWVCDRLGVVDRRSPVPDDVVITAGNSHGLEQLASLLTAPGDAVLVESPTYHLAVRILQDHPVELVPVPSDTEGLCVDSLPAIVERLRREGRIVRLLYTQPTFHNPTGISLAADRRRSLVDFAQAAGILIIEDDPYRELAYDSAAPPSLWSLASAGAVARLGTFSKTLAPGLRTGFITSDPTLTRRLCATGVLASGGGISHFTSLVVAEFAASGDYVSHVATLLTAYAQRRAELLSALARHVESRATWAQPAGGYFVWLSLAPPRDAAATLPRARAAGVGYMPGGAFNVPPHGVNGSLRLAFSRYAPQQLDEAVQRLAGAIDGPGSADRPRG